MANTGAGETIPIKADSQAGVVQTARLSLVYAAVGRGKEYFSEAFKQVRVMRKRWGYCKEANGNGL